MQPTRQPKLKEGVIVVFRQIQRAKVSILLWSRFLRHITWMCNAINIQVGVDCFKIFLQTYIYYFVCRFLGEKDTIRIGGSTAINYLRCLHCSHFYTVYTIYTSYSVFTVYTVALFTLFILLTLLTSPTHCNSDFTVASWVQKYSTWWILGAHTTYPICTAKTTLHCLHCIYEHTILFWLRRSSRVQKI